MIFGTLTEVSFQTARILKCYKSYQEVIERILVGIARVKLGKGGKGCGRVGGHEGSRKKIKSWLLEFPGLVQF